MLEKSGYYEILGVPKIASPEELKKGYRRAAMKIHPDKGGNTEKFKELGLAYSVLSDPEKRRKYDEELDARKKVVDELRCNDNPFRQQPLPKRGDDYVRELEVSLEELYSGTTETIPVTRRNISKDVVLEEKLFKVVVCPGMMNGQEIKFPRTGMFPGIVFVLKQKDHPRFERKNDDLFMERKLSLYQAQNGFSGFIETLDGRKIFIKTRPGKRFSVTVNHQGMPVYASEQPRWGDLHIRFTGS